MLCIFLGHRLPAGQRNLTVAMGMEAFQCQRCFHFIQWDTMPKKVQAMRAEYLARISKPIHHHHF